VVGGYALGGGLELALACDFIYATEEAKLGQTEARLGFVSGRGGSYRLSRRIGVPKAKELFYTGKILSSREAYEVGIVNFVGSRNEVESHLDASLKMIASNSCTAVSEMKKILNRCYDDNLKTIANDEKMASRRCITDSDTLNRINQFLNKK
ncbi:unnamed protein product, partial [marine sediment metagenome]